jgi:hypothetical protein
MDRRRSPIAILPLLAIWGVWIGGCAWPLKAQNRIEADPGRALTSSDLAVLEAREPRDDLPCRVTPVKPSVGFDLKFHAGYEVAIPMRELAGMENLLTVVFRVTPEGSPSQPVYFSQKIRVPAIEADAKGDAWLQGSFDLGEGVYQVDWLMRSPRRRRTWPSPCPRARWRKPTRTSSPRSRRWKRTTAPGASR